MAKVKLIDQPGVSDLMAKTEATAIKTTTKAHKDKIKATLTAHTGEGADKGAIKAVKAYAKDLLAA